MHRFGRPPYLRWAGAGAIVIVALVIELWPHSTVEHPFAKASIAAGDEISSDRIEWRKVPSGLLPTAPVGGVAAVDMARGEPLLPSHVAEGFGLPDGWWSVPVPMHVGVPPGTAVRLVEDAGSITEGIVIEPPSEDPFAFGPSGLVAVPADDAARIALAAAADGVTVIIAAG